MEARAHIHTRKDVYGDALPNDVAHNLETCDETGIPRFGGEPIVTERATQFGSYPTPIILVDTPTYFAFFSMYDINDWGVGYLSGCNFIFLMVSFCLGRV